MSHSRVRDPSRAARYARLAAAALLPTPPLMLNVANVCISDGTMSRGGGALFERFTDGSRRVVVLAQEESRLLRHDHIGTEHLLLGLLRVDDRLAAGALLAIGITLERVRT